MQVKHLLPTALFLFCSIPAIHAQRENVWVLGRKTRIDFNNGVPTPDTTSIVPPGGVPEANASICDTNGKFLFYTDGNTVWDRNYDTMFNGYGIADSNYSDITNSTTQGALIVPMPDSADKYYIFSLTSIGFSNDRLYNTWGRLYYSVVDMKLNNGLGGVIPGRKAIFVDSNLQEKMVSVVGSRCNIWVLTCDGDAHFRAYEITSSGVNTQPVISSVGIGSGYAPQGMIAVSPDRKKVASVQGYAGGGTINYADRYSGAHYSDAAVALFDFDAASGIVSNPVTLLPYSSIAYSSPILTVVSDSTGFGVCFSPDNSKLYYNSNGGKICQIDLSSGNPATMANSRTFIGTSLLSCSQLKLAANGKIYFFNDMTTIGSIDKPNLAGAACQITPNAITLDSGSSYNGLPNVISVFKRDTINVSYTINECGLERILLSTIDTSGWDYMWADSSYGYQRPITASGTYRVQYHTAPCMFRTDTFKIKIGDLPTPIIRVDSFNLSTLQSYNTYQWLLNGQIIPGATDSVYTVTENGAYAVVVSDKESGCTDTSAVYKVTNITNGVNSINRLQQGIKIYPNPVSDILYIRSPVAVNASISGMEGKQIKTVWNAQAIDLKSLAEGIYLVHVYNQEGILLKVAKFIKVK